MLLFSIFILVFALFVGSQSYTDTQVISVVEAWRSEVSFSLRWDAFEVLSRSIGDNLSVMFELWMDTARVREFIFSLFVTLPSCIYFVYMSAAYLRKGGFSKVYLILCFLASFSPMVLHVIAWDMHRWNTLAITTSFLLFFVVQNVATSEIDIKVERFASIVLVLLFVNATSSVPLFDGYRVLDFPFVEHFNFVNNLLYHSFPS